MQGKRVLITGASRGIGMAAARVFAAEGADVGLIARGGAAISALAAELGGLALPCDIADWHSVAGAVATMEARFGAVDVLINNAGVIDPIAGIDGADPDQWGKAIDINLKGVFHGMRAVLPGMLSRGAGTIITVSSGAAHAPQEGWSAYCASKAGASMLTRSLHLEMAGRGVRALGLSPGTVATDMQAAIRESGVNPISQLDWSAHIPPEWPARALLWMCGTGADPWLGEEVSLRDPQIRGLVGLAG
ncbi:NAD(P)-dependent dehydrogenase (short-subunit alcohol dehydrogenase family) [Rhodobacteraceae bacterium MBR-64]|jgi:NAD(P)-dependent dehydrogenase (short-subunit alcohol dehydrogenase family)